jgi:hypothetical protein
MTKKYYSKYDPLIMFASLFGMIVMKTSSLLQSMYDGIIPPLLGLDRLEAKAVSDYSNADMYVDEEHNVSGLYLWEIEAIGEQLVPGKHFLVLAAGGGREAIALIKKGIKVDAYECNKLFIDFGNKYFERENLPYKILPTDASKMPDTPAGQVYDYCIVGWSAYCHILRKDDRIQLLKGIRRVVNGPVLISFVNKPGMNSIKKFLRKWIPRIPGIKNDISDDLSANPSVVWVGFDENSIREEVNEAGYEVDIYKNHRPEYPYAVLRPSTK